MTQGVLLPISFPILFSHVKRKGNAVANNLAKLAKHSIAPQIWLEDIHSDEYCYQSCDSWQMYQLIQ